MRADTLRYIEEILLDDIQVYSYLSDLVQDIRNDFCVHGTRAEIARRLAVSVETGLASARLLPSTTGNAKLTLSQVGFDFIYDHEAERGKRISVALLPLCGSDVLGRPGYEVFELSLWMTLPTTRRVSSGGSSC